MDFDIDGQREVWWVCVLKDQNDQVGTVQSMHLALELPHGTSLPSEGSLIGMSG